MSFAMAVDSRNDVTSPAHAKLENDEPVGYEMSMHKRPLLRQQGNSGLAGSWYIILYNHLDQFLIITNVFRDNLTGRRQIPTIGHDK